MARKKKISKAKKIKLLKEFEVSIDAEIEAKKRIVHILSVFVGFLIIIFILMVIFGVYRYIV